jgi:hypothetical protein
VPDRVEGVLGRQQRAQADVESDVRHGYARASIKTPPSVDRVAPTPSSVPMSSANSLSW